MRKVKQKDEGKQSRNEKAEDKTKQQQMAGCTGMLRNHAQQGRQDVQACDHKNEPHVVMATESFIQESPFSGIGVITVGKRVQGRPEEKAGSHAQNCPFVQMRGIQLFLRGKD